MAAPPAFVFDAYGTLFDVHSVMEAARAVTPDPQALSQLWRQKQLEYTWLRSLMGRYQDFWLVTGQALRFALRRLGITAGESQIEALMSAYLTLSPFPEVPAALRALRGRPLRSEEHTSELQSRRDLVCRLLLEKKKKRN